MPRRLLRLSLLFNVGSLFLMHVSVALGRRVYYLDHLPLFNAMAAGILALSAAALATGLAGTWKVRGRSAWLWFADGVALLVLAEILFDS